MNIVELPSHLGVMMAEDTKNSMYFDVFYKGRKITNVQGLIFNNHMPMFENENLYTTEQK